MSDQQYNQFDWAPQIVDSKAKYSDNEERNKLTYNFVTDTRLKKGHNFGVIYVTNNEANQFANQNQNNNIAQKRRKQQMDPRLKNWHGEEQLYHAGDPNGLGCCTEKVSDTTHPKPITFEIECQTEPLPEQKKIIKPWFGKTGTDSSTQIEDGDWFNFDEEVAPLVHIIVSKTIEESRREVLEEEERAEIKRQKEKYSELNKQNEERVIQLEGNESNSYERHKKKNEDKIKRRNITKVFQKKLCSRVIAKRFLSTLHSSSLSNLENKGVFKSPEIDDYFTKLLPEWQTLAEENNKNDYVVVNKLNETLITSSNNKNINKHKLAIIAEKTRREDEHQAMLLQKQQEIEEAIRQKEERRRRRHDKILNAHRQIITEELLVNSEFTEDNIDNIYNINGYYQKTKSITCVGGPMGQISLLLSELNRLTPGFITDDKIPKIIDLFWPKSHQFTFLYSQEDLDSFKELDENVASMDDLSNMEDGPYKKVVETLYKNSIKYDDMLSLIFEVANSLSYERVEKYYELIFRNLLKKYKDGNDSGQVKFLLKDTAAEEIPLDSICLINPEVLKLPNPNEPVSESKKPGIPTKPTFEPFWAEKILLMPTVSEKIKIISINRNFDRLYRENVIACVNLLFKFDNDKEAIAADVNQNYEGFIKELLLKLEEVYKKEIVEITVEIPKEGDEEE